MEELLIDNDVANFDPVAEAFALFEPDETGAMSAEKLREVFSAYGFGDMSADEWKVLTRTADVDGDGVMTLRDFRAMLDRAERGPKEG